MTKIAELKGKHIAIVGFAVEGKSTLKFLLDNEVPFDHITILDAKTDIECPEGICLATGASYLQDLGKYDIIFKTAGMPIGPELLPYQDKILTQVQFFFDNYPGKVIAITASKGKSTMSSLAYTLLQHAGYKVKLVGNIGNPVLDEVNLQDPEEDFVVIELSSYMLQTLRKHNYISILGKIFPEHLDRHGSLAGYTQAKLNILEGSDTNIVHHQTILDNDLVTKYPQLIPYGEGTDFSRNTTSFTHWLDTFFPTSVVRIPGAHNLENICAITALADSLHIEPKLVEEAVASFTGLPHRLQDIGNHGGIRRIDDAISTTPESTIEAIKTYQEQIDTILLGGTDRGYDFSNLGEVLAQSKINNIVLFPPSGAKIKASLAAEQLAQYIILETSDMQEAVQFAYAHTTPGKICLLSTASPSYSNWKNFEEKGNLFQQYIQAP